MMATRDLDVAIMLLSTASCPNCDGSGGISIPTIESACCGEPLATGECCGNSIPEMGVSFEECQWCAEKAELMAKYDNK